MQDSLKPVKVQPKKPMNPIEKENINAKNYDPPYAAQAGYN